MNQQANLTTIAAGLKKVRWNGDYNFSACCPGHNDHNPSLSVTDINGKILVRCFAGCSQEQVIGALRDLRLWHTASKYQIDRRKRCKLKSGVRHHETVLALGIAMIDQGQELSETDKTQMKSSIEFLKDHANG